MVGYGQSRAGRTRLSALLCLGLHDSLADSAEHVCHPGKLPTVTRVLLHALYAPFHVTDEDLVLPSLLMHPFTQHSSLPAYLAWYQLQSSHVSTCFLTRLVRTRMAQTYR